MADKAFLDALERLKASGKVDLSSLDDILKSQVSLEVPDRGGFGGPLNLRDSTAADFNSPVTDHAGTPLWKRAVGTIDALRNSVASAAASQQKRHPHHESFINAVKDFIPDTVAMGKAAWGGLTHPIKNHEDTESIMDRAGVGEFKGRGAVEFLGDTVSDPLSLMTFGAGTVVKASARAGIETAGTLAKEAGVKVGKNAALHTPYIIREQTIAALTNKGIDPALAEQIATKKMVEAQKTISNAQKAARNEAQNYAVSLNVPFTNHTMGLIKKPGFLKIAERKIGSLAIPAATQLLARLGIHATGDSESFLKKTYGISNLEDMNVQQFEHLRKTANDKEAFVPPTKPAAPTQAPGMMPAVIHPGVEGAPTPHFTPADAAGGGTAGRFPDAMAELGHGADDVYEAGGSALAKHEAENALANIGGDAANAGADVATQAERLGLPGTSFTDFGSRASRAGKAVPEYEGAFGPADEILHGKGSTRKGGMNPVFDGEFSTAEDILHGGSSSRKGAARNTVDGEFSRIDDLMNDGSSVRSGAARHVVDGEVSGIGKAAGKAGNAAEGVTEHLDDVFKADKFVQDAGGVSKLGAKMPFRNAFNARTFGVKGEGILNKAAGDIHDASNKRHGRTIALERTLKGVENMMKGLTETERRAIPYLVEGSAPVSFSYKGLNKAKMQEVADVLKQQFKGISDAETKAGILDGVRENYFPHVLTHTEEDFAKMAEKYKDDPELSRLFQNSKKNSFGKARTSFDTLAQADNFTDGLREKLAKGGLSSEEADLMREKINDVDNLFERDPVKALQKRATASIKSTVMADLQKQFTESGLIWEPGKDLARLKDSTNFHKLSNVEANALGLKPNSYVHKEIFEALQKTEGVFTDKGIEKILKTADSFTSIWKSLVTTALPSHYVNNAIGNVFNMMLGGVSGKDYGSSYAFFRRLRKGTASKEDFAMLNEGLEQGILGRGFTSEFARKGLKATNGIERVEEFLRDTPPLKAMREILGEKPDNFFRMTMYMSAKSKLGDSSLAAAEVRKYLFNYHEMTGKDRAIRSVVPFWNWMKNNTPLQVQKFIQTPRYYAAYNRLQNQMNEGVDRPAWGEAYTKVPGVNQLINPHLPLDSLSDIDHPVHALLSGLNPLVKSPIELSQNQSIFTGKPIDYDKKYGKSQHYDPQALLDYFMKQSGAVGKVANLAGYGDTPWQEDLQAILTGKPVSLDK